MPTIRSFIRRTRTLNWKELLLLVAIVATFGRTISKGFAPSDIRHVDSQVFYTAGQSILHGLSPYDVTTADARWKAVLGKPYDPNLPFLNPPTFLPWLAATAWMPRTTWYRLMDGLHLAAIGAFVWFLFGLSGRLFPSASRTSRLFGLALAGLGTGLVSELSWGEDSFFVVLALVMAWRLFVDGRWRWAMSLLVCVASIKPQLSLVPSLALVVGYSRPKQWLFAGLVGAAYCLAIGLAFGFSIYRDFVASLALWPGSIFNRPEEVSGLMNLGAQVGLRLSPFSLLVTSIVLGTLLAAVYRALRWPQESADHRTTSLVLVLLTVWILNEALLPFHAYDHSFAMIPLALTVHLGGRIGGLILPPLLVAARPGLLSRLVGPAISLDRIITWALLLSVLIGSVAVLWPKSKEPSPSAAGSLAS